MKSTVVIGRTLDCVQRVGAVLGLMLSLSVRMGAQSPTRSPGPDIIKGSVTSDSTRLLIGADVFVTVAPSAEIIATRTDSMGRFRVVVPTGTGQYVVTVSALGFRTSRQRVLRVVGDSQPALRFQLAPAVTQISAMQVLARRGRPQRTFGTEAFAGGLDGTDKAIDGALGAIAPGDQGSVLAVATWIPGVTMTTTGITAFGLPSGESAQSVNGMATSGLSLPRDFASTTRYRSSPWDPTIGAFSSITSATNISRGQNISRKSGHASAVSPTLIGTRFGGVIPSGGYAQIDIGQGGTGALALERRFYNYGLELSQRVGRTARLSSLTPAELALFGLSLDTLTVLNNALRAVGAPIIGANGDAERKVFAKLGVRLDGVSESKAGIPGPSWALTGITSLTRLDNAGAVPIGSRATLGSGQEYSGILHTQRSVFLGPDGRWLSTIASAVSISGQHTRPYQDTPGGAVGLQDSTQRYQMVGFGGNPALARDAWRGKWETIEQVDFLWFGRSALPAKLYLSSSLGMLTQTPRPIANATFTYASIADLARNVPSTISYIGPSEGTHAATWAGVAALATSYSVNNLFLTGGLRLDREAVLTSEQPSSDLRPIAPNAQVFPASATALSPRVGFVWRYRGGPKGFSSAGGALGTVNRGGTQLRGGVGRFRGVIGEQLLVESSQLSREGADRTALTCYGSGLVGPDFQESVNAQDVSNCAQPVNGPAVTLFNHHFRPSSSWRGSVGWSSSVKGVFLAIDATAAANKDQAGIIDRNFRPVQRFALVGEGDRAVYVSPYAIDSGGAVNITDSRVTNALRHAFERTSDLGGSATQVTVYAVPPVPLKLGLLTLGYTYTTANRETRGFDNTTAGDPRVIENTAPSFAPHHQMVLQSAVAKGAWGVTLAGRLTSGSAFTPIVSSDINGDGLANDRAFVTTGAASSDASASHTMEALLTERSRRGSCLRNQLGAIAAAGSCSGPWGTTMNAAVAYLQPLPHTAERARASLHISNVAALADRLVHGGHLRGWGSPAIPDPILYRVTGFDQTKREYRYMVNGNFGATQLSAGRTTQPFAVTLDVSVDLGRGYAEQELIQRLRLRPSLLGTRAPADSLKKHYRNSNYTDVYRILTLLADSLALTREQVDVLQRGSVRLTSVADSIYAALGEYLAALPDSYTMGEAVQRIRSANDAMWEVIFSQREQLSRILTKGQIRLLPRAIFEMMTNPASKMRFFFG